MADLGLCVSKDAAVTPSSLSDVGARWARWTGDPQFVREQEAYCRALKARSIKRFLTLDADSYRAFGPLEEPATWRRAAEWYADTFTGLVDAINPVNEPDGTGYESSQMPLEMVNGMIRETRRAWGRSAQIVAVGSVSGIPSYYDQIDLSLLDGIDGHFYAKFPPAEHPSPDFSLERIINEHKRFGLPIWMSEIGISSDREGEERQAQFLRTTMAYVQDRADVVACFWFCAHSYDGWGLWRPDGSLKPSWQAFRDTVSLAAPPIIDPCERDRQRLLQAVAYVRTTPSRKRSWVALRKILEAA